jgi:hypothetical protein
MRIALILALMFLLTAHDAGAVVLHPDEHESDHVDGDHANERPERQNVI